MTDEETRQLDLQDAAVRFRFSGYTDKGAVRRLNEDSFLAVTPIFVVADGMGGHSFGDRASAAATQAFVGIDALLPASAADILDRVRLANDAVLTLTDDTEHAGSISGTTLSGVAFVSLGANENYHWMVFNVGDSRVYSWDGRHLEQVSVDHSAVQELVDAGMITKAEAERHPDRNIVTRALGADPDVDPDVWLMPAKGRQTFLLCSDGLVKELSDDEIARIIVFHDAELLRHSDSLPMTLAERLGNAAIAAGGKDNVTVVVVESLLSGVGEAATNSEDTVERGAMSSQLEETMPRG